MKNKILQVALSVVIAFALWVYVISVVSPESEDTFYDIPVSYQNDVLEERGLMIVSEKPTVTLKLKGNRSDLTELNPSNITILVDLAAIQAPGTHMLKPSVSYPANLPNNAFETLSQTPNLLLLKVENRVKKQVPIRLEYIGNVPNGFVADKETPTIDVPAVEIVGPESVVSQIAYASIPVDLTNQSESVVGQFNYTLCSEDGEPVDAQMITTNVETVSLTVKIQRLKEVPLVLNLMDGGGATKDTCDVKLSKETIWVSGSDAKLRELEFVELGTVNLADLKNETNTMDFDVILPEGVTNTSGVSQVTATITFPELGRKKLVIGKEQFLSLGVAEGMEVVWITEMIEVEFRGPRELIKNLNEKDITITVDFSEEKLGGVSVVPKLTISAEFSGVGAISVPTLTATLQEIPEDGTEG